MLAHESLKCYINYFSKCLLISFTFVFQLKRDSGGNKGWGNWLMNAKAFSYAGILCWNALDSCENHRSIQFVADKSC